MKMVHTFCLFNDEIDCNHSKNVIAERVNIGIKHYTKISNNLIMSVISYLTKFSSFEDLCFSIL